MTVPGRVAAFAGETFAQGMQWINARHPWSHNDHFHGWIVANLPENCDSALDVGCGLGELLAVLAPHVKRVIGSDADATMLEQSARRCVGLPNVAVDGGAWPEIAGPFDAITMVAVLHHLDVEEALEGVTRLLSPGGAFPRCGAGTAAIVHRQTMGSRIHGHEPAHRDREAPLAEQGGNSIATVSRPGPHDVL